MFTECLFYNNRDEKSEIPRIVKQIIFNTDSEKLDNLV